MVEVTNTQILVAVEECIERFIAERRSRVKDFVAEHFSLQETVEIQKKTFLHDLISNPINAAWAIPYLAVKKIAETTEKLGWDGFNAVLLWIPSGIKTGYQKKIEKLVATEFLDWNQSSKESKNGLLEMMREHPELARVIDSSAASTFSMTAEFRSALDRYCTSRALISDLSGSVLSFFVGWSYFGDRSLGIMGMGDRIARRMARDKAADNFFLGKSFGTSFYNAFPPHPTQKQVFLATLFMGFLLTIFSLIATAMSDPCLKKLGLQERKLNALLTDLESTLLIQYKRRIKLLIQTPG